MDKRFVAVLIFAFFVATLASMALYRLTINRPAHAAPLTKLVFAARDLEQGTMLREGDLVLTNWFGDPPSGASFQKEEFVGRGVTSA
jgi:pilus assembly protein CpaB